MRIIDEKFRKNFASYLFQSFLAFLTMGIILFFLDILTQGAIVAALGSSGFVVFAMPDARIARPRNLIGGHFLSTVIGSLCSLLFLTMSRTSLIFSGALAVGLSIFLMVVTNTEHPPAAGTALGLAICKWNYQMVIFVLAAVSILSFVRWLLKPWLKDLV